MRHTPDGLRQLLEALSHYILLDNVNKLSINVIPAKSDDLNNENKMQFWFKSMQGLMNYEKLEI